MRLRIGSTESVLLVVGIAGLVEQEAFRVALTIQPSTLISGICFAFVLIGAGVTLGRNFKIGPVEIALREKESEETEALKERQKHRRARNGGSR